MVSDTMGQHALRHVSRAVRYSPSGHAKLGALSGLPCQGPGPFPSTLCLSPPLGSRVKRGGQGHAWDCAAKLAPRPLFSPGLFFAIGHKPATKFLQGQVELDSFGLIKTEPGSQCTSVPGACREGVEERKGQGRQAKIALHAPASPLVCPGHAQSRGAHCLACDAAIVTVGLRQVVRNPPPSPRRRVFASALKS